MGCGGDLGPEEGSGAPPADVFLVQEYCSGGSLQQLVFKQARACPPAGLGSAVQCAETHCCHLASPVFPFPREY